MNKQGNTYTLIYIIVMVVLVGTALAFTSISLKDKQQANADADRMRQILASVNIEVPADKVIETYKQLITETTADGNDALPVFQCKLIDGAVKYILPMRGAGLWGPIWGYVSVDADGSTIYGTYFAHAGETPGLGAEIEKKDFRDRFIGKHLIVNDKFVPVAVLKSGQKPAGNEDYVDAISGATITSKGVGAMIDNCLAPYSAYLENLAKSANN